MREATINAFVHFAFWHFILMTAFFLQSRSGGSLLNFQTSPDFLYIMQSKYCFGSYSGTHSTTLQNQYFKTGFVFVCPPRWSSANPLRKAVILLCTVGKQHDTNVQILKPYCSLSAKTDSYVWFCLKCVHLRTKYTLRYCSFYQDMNTL